MKPNSYRAVFERIKRVPGGCWIWQGNTAPNGYGLIRVGGKWIGAHRAAFMAVGGVIPEGKEIDHLCAVKNCVNPEHMEAVTKSVNLRRVFERRKICSNGHLKAIGISVCGSCHAANRKRFRSSEKHKAYQRLWHRKWYAKNRERLAMEMRLRRAKLKKKDA